MVGVFFLSVFWLWNKKLWNCLHLCYLQGPWNSFLLLKQNRPFFTWWVHTLFFLSEVIEIPQKTVPKNRHLPQTGEKNRELPQTFIVGTAKTLRRELAVLETVFFYIYYLAKGFYSVLRIILSATATTICPRSSDPFCIVSY